MRHSAPPGRQWLVSRTRLGLRSSDRGTINGLTNPALEKGQLQSFAYDGRHRILEIELRVIAPFAYGRVPLPPPYVIQYFDVPRYVFTKLLGCKAGRRQERYWEDTIQRRFQCQTVRTVCRLPRIWRFHDARNIRRHTFEDYLKRMSPDVQEALQIVVATMKVLLLRTLAPRREADLGGLLRCASCGSVGTVGGIRHGNCLWFGLSQSK